MSANKEANVVEKTIDLCTMVQSMIDFTAKHLFGLRTQCATTEEITQSEIRDTESKLIKLFSKQLVAKAKLATDGRTDVNEKLSEYPHTEQWLNVVGVQSEAIKGIVERGLSLDTLLEMSDEEVRNLLLRYETDEEDMIRLTMALRNLKFWTEKQLGEGKSKDGDIELHWTSYKPASNSPYQTNSPKHQQRPSTSSLPPDTYLNTQSSQLPTPPQSNPSSPVPGSTKERYRFTPPPTPPLVRPKSGEKKYISTPPPKKKMTLLQDVPLPLTKSKSHESQLASRVIDVDNVKATFPRPLKKKPHNLKFGGSYEAIPPRCASNEGSDVEGNNTGVSGHPSSVPPSPLRSPPNKHHGISSVSDDFKPNTLTVPRSPKAPYHSRMLHAINHRFTHTFKITTCDYCHKQMFLGFKCKECKFKCHRDCASKAAPSCSLPNEYVQVFINSLKEGSPNAGRRVDNPNLIFPASTLDGSGLRPVFQIPDSSSNTSSCNSSTPSSPAPGLPASASITSPSPGPSPQIQFKFPEIDYGYPAEASTDGLVEYRSCTDDDIVNTNTSNDSDKTLIDSNTSEKTLPDRVDSLDSQDDPFGHNWNRQNSLSVTLKEWDIPFGDLALGDDIGTGRFGTVYRGQWHGDVAIKMLKMDPDKDNQAQMSAFKLEVAMLRKTRHDNLVLFMGACMKPPHLAIVTSLCKGKTLYTHIHSLKEKFPMNKTVIIASQIAQGMGYLHARGIVHKDLKTKNIFLERDRVIITDFGLFNVTKLCGASRKGNWLSIPPGWLCYLSPEIICSLQAGSHFHCNSDLPFSEQSDVYAFGTVWYELLTGEWPFKKMPAETIIWQVGRGLKQSLSNVQASRDVKDVLMICWTYKPSDRPDFSRLLKALERLPKKRLLRSPSHPVHLSRSAESVI